MSKKIPKAYKVLVVIFFIFYFFVLMPMAQEQFTGIEKFLFLIIVSLLSSMLAALLFYLPISAIKRLVKGKAEDHLTKSDSSPNIILTTPMNNIPLDSSVSKSENEMYQEPEHSAKQTNSLNMTVSFSSTVPPEVLQSMRTSFTFSQAQNCERIIQESLDIMRKTNNLDTFFSRSELAMQNALTLRQAEQSGVSGVYHTYETCQTVFETIQKKKLLALDSSFNAEKEKIAKLVRPQTQIKHWEKYLEILDKYMDKYETDFSSEFLEVYSYVKREIQELNYDAVQLKPINTAITKSSLSKSENEILFKYFSCEDFSDLEAQFMIHLHKAIVNSNLNPYGIKLHRLSNGTFNVNYSDSHGGCYVGKIDLSSYTAVPDKYAVMKNGQKRAKRVLDSEEEAKAYMEQYGGDYIELRQGYPAQYFMQYLSGKDGCTVHIIESSNFQDYIDGISHWIKYIKKCQKSDTI